MRLLAVTTVTHSLDSVQCMCCFLARSAGGYTWAELWHLADRQPEIQEYVAECAHALTSDPATGTMWWAHPGGGADGHDR